MRKFLGWPLKVKFASYFLKWGPKLQMTMKLDTCCGIHISHCATSVRVVPLGDFCDFRQLEEMSCSSTCTLAAVLQWACGQLESNHWICPQKKTCSYFRTPDFVNPSLLIVTNSCWCHQSNKTSLFFTVWCHMLMDVGSYIIRKRVNPSDFRASVPSEGAHWSAGREHL